MNNKSPSPPITASLEEMNVLLDTIPHGIQENDLEGTITLSNRAHAQMLGYQVEQVIGKKIWDFLPDEEQKTTLQDYLNYLVAEQPEPQPYFSENIGASGELINIKVDWNYKYDAQGDLVSFISVLTNITEQKQIETALKESESQYRLLVEHSPNILYRFSNKHGGIFYSSHVEKVLGYTPDELCKKNMLWHDSIHPDDLPAVDAAIAGFVNGEDYDVEYRIKDAAGKWHWFHDRNIAIHHDGDEIFTDGIATDITETKQAKQDLAQTAAEWTDAMNVFEDAVYLLDLDRRVIRANKSFFNMVHLTEKQVIGRHITEIVHPKGELIPCPVCQAQEAKQDAVITMEDNHPDNPSGVPIEVICQIIRNDSGEPMRILMTIRDLSRARQEAEKLRQSEIALSEAQRIAHIGNWLWDVPAETLQWSNEIYRIFGLNPQQFDISYQAFINFIHPDDRDMVVSAIDYSLYHMKPFNIDHRICLPDGSVRFVQQQAEVRYDDQGNPLRVLGTIQDITDRILAEKALIKSETRFRATFEQAAVGVAQISPDGRWLKVNKRLCDIVGYSDEELLHATFQDITHPDDLDTELNYVAEMLNGIRSHYSMEKRYIRKYGQISWVNITASLVRDNKSNPDYFISVIEDINERKASQDKIARNLQEKDALLRELHHRVKNNMQVISSILSIQSRNVTSSNIQKAFTDSRQRIRAMSLIHERLYASADLGHIDMKDYIHYLSTRLRRLHESSHKKINIQISGDNMTLSIDSALPCALIINELLTNTIYHAYPEDNVIRADINLETSTQNIISITDYGIGFDVDKAQTSNETFGMLIINALIQQLGGNINFTINNGTQATITLPIIADNDLEGTFE